MSEIKFDLSARDTVTGRFKSARQELARLGKTASTTAAQSKLAAASLKQLRADATAAGMGLKSTATPAIKQSAESLRNLEVRARAANLQLVNTRGVMGLTASGANAFTRAATRATAAIGFISPTAATASAQLIGLTNASAGATLAIGALAIGAIALGGVLFKSSQAAIEFESSFRGIRKTVDATEQEYAVLEKANRNLAKSLGENVNEINAIGQAAGQLGVAIGDLAAFEKIVIELASASDIGAKSAAFSFGGLIEVLDLTIKDLDNLTDEIVALGNSFAATESEIVGFMNRISGAGAVLKIPAQDLAAIATAFAALRIPAEAGGTAVQKVFLAMQKAAVAGGEELRVFSKLLNITAESFQDLIRNDPTAAFLKFVNALGRSGEEAQLWLEALGLNNERTRRAFLTAAASGDLLNRTLEEGAAAYKEGTARTEEFEKALAITKGQLRLAGAAFADLAISIGNVLLPFINEAASAAVLLSEALVQVGKAAAIASDGLDKLGGPAGKLALAALVVKAPVPGARVAAGALVLAAGIEAIGASSAETILSLKGLDKEIDRVRASLEGVTGLDLEFAGVKELVDIVAELSGIAPESFAEFVDLVDNLGNAADEAASSSSTLSSELAGSLAPSIGDITDKANEARDALFAMFKKPTREEKQLELVVNRLKQQALALQTQLAPLTEAQQAQLDHLNKSLIPSAQRLLSVEKLYGDELSILAELEHGELLTRRELAAATSSQAEEVRGLTSALGDATTTGAGTTVAIDINTDSARAALDALFETGGLLARTQFAMSVDAIGHEQAIAAVQALIDTGQFLAAQDFAAQVRVTGVEEAILRLQLLGEALDLVTRMAIEFRIGVLGQKRPVVPTALPTFQQDPNLFAGPDAQSFLDTAKAAEKAKKEIDPFKDGIITLAEAIEFGISKTEAATGELAFSLFELRSRLFRVTVETIKLARAERQRQDSARVLIDLAELELERTKVLREQAIELRKLAITVEQAGLASNVESFRFAMVALGEEFRKAEESTLEFLSRLTNAAQSALRTRFDALFNRPTQEEAQANLMLAHLRRQRILLLRGGADDSRLSAIDAEIERIEQSNELRRAEQDVLRAQADLADRTLLSDRERIWWSAVLISFIEKQSRVTDVLNTALALETLAHLRARDALDEFIDALQTAPGRLPQAAASFSQPLLANKTALAPNFSVEVNVAGQSREEILAVVARELERQFDAANIGSSTVSSGTFIPS